MATSCEILEDVGVDAEQDSIFRLSVTSEIRLEIGGLDSVLGRLNQVDNPGLSALEVREGEQ